MTTAQTNFLMTTVSVDLGSTASGAVGCATFPLAGAATTDHVLATAQTMVPFFALASAHISATDILQVCLINTDNQTQNPGAVTVFVMDVR